MKIDFAVCTESTVYTPIFRGAVSAKITKQTQELFPLGSESPKGYWPLASSSALGVLSPDHSSQTSIEFAGFFDEYFKPATPISR